MAGDTVARSVNKFIYIRVGGQIRWIYPPLNKPKTLSLSVNRQTNNNMTMKFLLHKDIKEISTLKMAHLVLPDLLVTDELLK